MVKESKTAIDHPRLLFRETFRDEQSVIANGGTVTSVVFSEGKGTFDGASSKIEYRQTLSGVQSVQINLTLTTTTEDILKLSSSHSIEVGSGTVTATGFTAPTIYVDGAATTTITTGEHQIIVTTGTAFTADALIVGTVTGFLNGTIYYIAIPNYEMSAEEISNIYEGKRFHELTGQTEILSVSAVTGSIIDRWGNILTLTSMSVVKHGEANVMILDGSSSKIDCGVPDTLVGDKTFVWWMKPYFPSTYPGTARIFENGEFYIRLGSSGRIFIVNSGATIKYSKTNLWKQNEWVFVVVTRASAGTTTVYKNGSEYGPSTGSDGTPVAGDTNLILGNRSAGNLNFEGPLSNIRIYDGLLTAAQVSQIFGDERKKYSV